MNNDKIAEKLNKMSTPKLINVVKKYGQSDYPMEIRDMVLDILKSRGIAGGELKLLENFENDIYRQAEGYYTKYKTNSNISFFLFILSVFAIFSGSAELFALIYIVFLIFLVRSFINRRDFYRVIENKPSKDKTVLYFIFSIPFYFAVYFIVKKEIEDGVNSID